MQNIMNKQIHRTFASLASLARKDFIKAKKAVTDCYVSCRLEHNESLFVENGLAVLAEVFEACQDIGVFLAGSIIDACGGNAEMLEKSVAVMEKINFRNRESDPLQKIGVVELSSLLEEAKKRVQKLRKESQATVSLSQSRNPNRIHPRTDRPLFLK